MSVHVFGVTGLPLIHPGDDLPALLCGKVGFSDGDILCIASTVYSKSKGYVRTLASITPGPVALRIAERDHEDPRFVQSVLDEATEVLLDDPFVLSEMVHGHIGVRSGVDRSNIEDGFVILLPPDPKAAAEDVRTGIQEISRADTGVIITDTVGRAFRRGQTGHAIGWSGIPAIRDFRGDHDLFGHTLQITEEAVIDEIAGFANFIMGESDQGVPAVVFRGCGRWSGHDNLYFSPKEDVMRKALRCLQEKRSSR